MKKIVILVLFIFFISCSTETKKEKFPGDSVLQEKINFKFAIYLFEDNGFTIADVIKYVNINYKEFEVVQNIEIVKTTPQLLISEIINVQNNYAPPTVEFLEYFKNGLTKEEMNKLQYVQKAYIFNFVYEGGKTYELMKISNTIMYDLSSLITGVIWDEETRECFAPLNWKEKRIDTWEGDIPDIKGHISIHYYKSNELFREITLGMKKFGLPDVIVNDLPASSSGSMFSLINLVCQTMVEKQKIDIDGKLKINIDEIVHKSFKKALIEILLDKAEKKAEISIAVGVREKGDPDNILLEIDFNNFWEKNIQINQDKLLKKLFGYTDNITYIDHDEKLLEISNAAKKRVIELKENYLQGFEAGECLLVKLPFYYEEVNTEWMWVEVVKWENDKITGILQNDPYHIENLKSGSTVVGNENDIFDYILKFADGSSEGNETGKYIKENQ